MENNQPLINPSPESNPPPEIKPAEPQPVSPPPPPVFPPPVLTPEAPPEKKPWGAWPTIGFGAVILLVFFVAQNLVSFIFVLSNPNVITNTTALANLSTNGLLVSIAVLVSAVAGFVMTVVFIRLRKNIGVFEYLGLHRPKARTIFIVLGISLGLLLVVTYIESLFGQGAADNSNFTSDAYRTAVYPALLWIAVVIFAPVFEESFFRGFLFAGLVKSRLGAVGTILLTAVIFGVLHFQYNWAGMGEVIILGIVLGTVRLKSGSLFASIAVHSFWNFIATLVTALTFYGILH